MKFDLNTIWSRGVELIRDNFQLLIVIAGVFLLLPNVAIYLLIPDFQMLADPTADPDIVAERMGEMIGPLVGIGLFGALVQFAGYGAMVALMGDHRPTVGQALGTGFKTVPSLLVVMILFMLGYFIGALIIMVPISLLAGVAGVPTLGLIGVIPVLIYVAWLMARMSMTMPTMVLEGKLNPFGAVARSFSLTKAKQWQILAFWLLIVVIMTVLSVLVNGVVGVVAALLGTGTLAMLLLGLFSGATGMATGILTCGLSVAMFNQLAGVSAAAIEETFE